MIKQKTHILFLIDTIVSEMAGTEKQLIKLMEGLPNNTFQCHLSCFTDTEWLKSSKLSIPVFIWGSSSLCSLKFYIGLFKFIQYVRKYKIDIIQTYFPTSITVGLLVAKIAGIKRLISCRRDMGFWYTPFLIFILRLSRHFIKRYLVNSFEIKKLIQVREKIDSDKITVIHNGIDIPRMLNKKELLGLKKNIGVPQNVLIIGTVANMNRRVKRLDIFIKAASKLLHVYNQVIFIIVGSGYLMGRLKSLSSDLGIYEKVIFLGSRNDSLNLIQTFDVGVNSSDSEGLSNAVLEYMICGVPVVVTDCGGNSEIVTNGYNGRTVPPGNDDALSNAILDCLLNTEKRKQMGQNAQKTACNYSMSRMIKKHEDLYMDLMGERTS